MQFLNQKRRRENEDFAEVVGETLLNSLENKMNSGIGKLNWDNIKSALVFGVLSALLAIGTYVVGVGDIFSLDGKVLANVGAFGGLNVILSLVKRLLTNNDSEFLGIIKTE
ncbi:MAG: hypothetical protein AABW88_02500 [Nanoarchaeota archaeon]